MISGDVFEHVYDIDKTLSEAYRVLRSNGKLFITIPFFSSESKNVKRAELISGELNHLLPPEYHGSTRRGEKGVLVFYDYGWDILGSIKNVGFQDTYLLMNFDNEKMFLDSSLAVIVAEKKDFKNEAENEFDFIKYPFLKDYIIFY